MTALTRADILAAEDLPLAAVDVPEWGGQIFVRAMSALDRAEVEAYLDENPGRVALRAIVAVVSIRDEHGARLFTVDDIPALNEKSSTVLDRVFARAASLSGMTSSSREAIRKNS